MLGAFGAWDTEGCIGHLGYIGCVGLISNLHSSTLMAVVRILGAWVCRMHRCT